MIILIMGCSVAEIDVGQGRSLNADFWIGYFAVGGYAMETQQQLSPFQLFPIQSCLRRLERECVCWDCGPGRERLCNLLDRRVTTVAPLLIETLPRNEPI
jgi:hypothetical protein